jgi:DNA-binding MarR family transcriptional regulator
VTAHELGMALRLAYLTLHRRTNALMAEEGVTADQFVVLSALAEGDALSQNELAERTASDRNTLRAMLLLLEKRGFIERTQDSRDKRVWQVSLSRAGRRSFQKLWRHSESLRQEILAAIPGDDMTSLVELLRSLTAALDRPSDWRSAQAKALQ